MYRVRFYKGDYIERQRAANRDRCVGYVEHHFNSTAGTGGDYAAVIVGSNASNTSKNWAQWYARAVASSFGIGLARGDGVLVGGFNGRGDGNVRFTDMPAILLEPLFANNPTHAQWIKSDEGQQRLARILADSIQRCFPKGGLIAFSVGHKYKSGNPRDRGCAVYGGGVEADYAEIVMTKAAAMLEAMGEAREARPFAVMIGNREVWRYDADPDAVVRWDELRGILFIDEPGTLDVDRPVAGPQRTLPPASGPRRTGRARGPARKAAGRRSARKTAARGAAARKTTAKRGAGKAARRG